MAPHLNDPFEALEKNLVNALHTFMLAEEEGMQDAIDQARILLDEIEDRECYLKQEAT